MSELSVGNKEKRIYDRVYGIDQIREWINSVFRRKDGISRSNVKEKGRPDDTRQASGSRRSR